MKLLSAVYARLLELLDWSLASRDRSCRPELNADVPSHAMRWEPPISLAVRSTMEASYGAKR